MLLRPSENLFKKACASLSKYIYIYILLQHTHSFVCAASPCVMKGPTCSSSGLQGSVCMRCPASPGSSSSEQMPDCSHESKCLVHDRRTHKSQASYSDTLTLPRHLDVCRPQSKNCSTDQGLAPSCESRAEPCTKTRPSC